MKKLINGVDQIVSEMVEGLVAAHPDKLRAIENTNVIVRADAPVQGKVALISGGGSGHEPAHAGYVGEGLLDAAVSGEVFTSPTPDQVLEAIKAVDSGAGVLLIVKNYSGDVMNFDMAADLAEAEDITVKQVVIRDDVAISNPDDRRGVAGTTLVHMIAGAAAAEGKSLDEVEAIAQGVADNVRSMGVSLAPCTVPASGKPGFTLEENEMEIGTGIHGEQGVERRELMQADAVTEELVQHVLDDMHLNDGSEVALMINGQGATPLMELYIVARKAIQLLKDRGIHVKKTFVGEYMTSLEMTGCSVTILNLDEERKRLLLSGRE
ncbi:dihydroxyacetone kinase subunit DhaK [Marinococcus halophilus]|uniref:Dihydroxyacetone kinase subunit DhaK n=1 Tax=Marinococcus halophilus TaxID=1371 RepID=A0A510Y9H9_MARHA|nr:dihydroxyacetone kinase subunit DhaK [Marinococcus halophilus]OZT78999.1 dihydroxyacetone kinase subunit DhaK [Marinococcus halophilus]GEK60015.1 dihydroxyacetone kinase subunit DhaK [Marinococcus halophilus]